MKKRWTAALLALALAFALLPAPALAAPDDGSAGSRLTGIERDVYDHLKAEITKIAKGTRTSAEIRIPDHSGLRWSVKELGAGDGREDVLAKLREKLAEALDMDRVYDCLAADLPYELFWRDDRYSSGYSLSREGDSASVRNMIIEIQVSEDYRGISPTSTDPAKITAANETLKNAQAIVDKYRDKSDFEKLTGYRDEICWLASYNTDAAWSDMPYGNPWQMIYVFDGDKDTNVVCEGYAKAFKYLCDLSEFDGDVVCRIVTGKMGNGDHMWNVVRMGDGKNYLVDVTNCDSGTVGEGGRLFLVGAQSEDGRTYTVSKEGFRSVYTYDERQAGLFADGYLALSGEDYVDRPGVTVTVTPAETEPPEKEPGGAVSFTDVPGEEYYAEPVAWAVEKEITAGTSETTFSPDDPCTHGQILTFLWRAAEKPDAEGEAPEGVDREEYYYDAVCWAAGLGMLEEGFDPEAGCARADAVWYIWRALDGPEDQAASFTDVPNGAPYAHAVGWAVLKGVTKGATEDTFEPDTICSRGQIVTFLHRAYS